MTFLRNCWQSRWVRFPIWTIVSLVTLYALACALINWSGARRWREAQATVKAEGESLDFRATVVDPVPDAENFCATPLLKDLALVVEGDQSKGAPGKNRERLKSIKLPATGKDGPRPKLGNVALGRPADLKAWAKWLRQDGSFPMPAESGAPAGDVLAALSKYDDIARELAVGLDRPRAQWTPAWKTRDLPPDLFSIALPQLASVMEASRTLTLRSVAAARAGEASNAHTSALVVARLSQASLDDPFLIGALVAVADAGLLVNATWEICDAQAGSAEDFQKLETALSTLDFHRGLLQAWRSELAGAAGMLQFIKGDRQKAAEMATLGGGGTPVGMLVKLTTRLIPDGLFDANGAVLVDQELHSLLNPLRDQSWPDAIRSGAALETEMTQIHKDLWLHPDCFLAAMITPAVKSVVTKAGYTQTLVHQATIACALERFRIANGTYPDSLDAVKLADGKPLPLDGMDGKPMRYRKTADGKYALWSVGFDGKDDGGKRALDPKNPENTKFQDAGYVGDWVWDFPTK
jgi:hypothetical protein